MESAKRFLGQRMQEAKTLQEAGRVGERGELLANCQVGNLHVESGRPQNGFTRLPTHISSC